MIHWRRFLATSTIAALAATGISVATTPTASASPCNALGITGGDVGSTGSSGSTDLGMGSADFGSYRAGGKKPQGPLPELRGATRAVQWVTGPRSPNRTDKRFAITSTDLGVPWDNGSGQVLMAFGDTWGPCGGRMVWRHNTMLRSRAAGDLANGIAIPNAVAGSIRSGASVTAAHPTFAQPIVNAVGVRNIEVGRIPTGGISIGGVQYLSYMSIRKWLGPGRWSTNFSAIAVSRNNGQTWVTDNNTIRANTGVTIPGVPQAQSGHSRFQMGAFVRAGEWIYQYGTPSGRRGSAYVARFRPADITNLNAYQYYAGGNRWTSSPDAAAPVVTGPVSEMSVSHNDFLKKFVMLTERRGTITLRTAPTPSGPWSGPRALVTPAQSNGLYAPYIHPRSTGQQLYFLVSRWDDYNVALMRTDLGRLR